MQQQKQNNFFNDQFKEKNKTNDHCSAPISSPVEMRKRTRRRGLREGKGKDERNDATTREDQSLSEFDDFTNAMPAMEETRTGGEVLLKNKKSLAEQSKPARRQRRRETRNQTAPSTQRNWARIHRTKPTTNINYQHEQRPTQIRKHSNCKETKISDQPDVNLPSQPQRIQYTRTSLLHTHTQERQIQTEPPRHIKTNREHPMARRR